MSAPLHSNEETAQGVLPLDSFAVAAGLLSNDRHLLLPLLLFLALSAVLQSIHPPHGLPQLAALLSFDRLLQLGAISFIVLRWRKRLQYPGGKAVNPLVAGVRIIVAGFLVWATLMLPLAGAAALPASGGLSIFVFILFFGVFFAIRFYFYFAIFGLLGGSMSHLLHVTFQLARRDPMAAIRSIVSPLAIMFLAVALLSVPAPDGRSIFWATIGSAAEGIFWVLATYTGLAFALVGISDSEWRSAGLDPYRRDRLGTLEAQGRGSRFNRLSPKIGIKLFFIAACVWLANTIQVLGSGPAAQVKVVQCEAQNYSLRVVLEVSDEQHLFRGFNPFAFTLATQTGFAISSQLEKVSLTPGGPMLTSLLPPERGPIRLYLQFRSNKRGEALQALDNMWLWYHQKALIPIKVDEVSETPADTTEIPVAPQS